ncbi:SDR family NAD(P)-dependent oxidoreductase, partial [Escherichia coli]|uniref:SDR family NAD(P)-dependent oxidoreductase n=1 Tax=Escherichia coli TaxID=562 RepID=UPI00200E7DCA
GARVIIADRDAHGEAAAASLRESGAQALFISCNIAEKTQVEALFSQAEEAFGPVDILVNNAGIWLSGYVTEISPQDWDLVMNVNLKAIFHLSQLFVNHCLQHDQMGSSLNITSQAAFHGSTTGHAHYAASKAGLVAFAISLAREVAKQKINVNNIAVGIMDTAMIRKNIEQNPDYYVSRIPVGRVAQPQEIADIGVFMVSPKTSDMTG